MDVKCGHGAFMKNRADARKLAESLVATGNANGVRTPALVTAMDAPLGRAVGNALEVIESLETLKGRGPADLEELSVTLAARMVLIGLSRGVLWFQPGESAELPRLLKWDQQVEGEVFAKSSPTQGGDQERH